MGICWAKSERKIFSLQSQASISAAVGVGVEGTGTCVAVAAPAVAIEGEVVGVNGHVFRVIAHGGTG
jgi:hypothetical protein